MKIQKSGQPPKLAYYKMILELRRQGKSITEIAKVFKVNKQNISYYICRYGDINQPVDN